MATKKKSGASRSKNAPSHSTTASRQLKAVIWFAASVFLLFIVFIRGENIWTTLHNFFFGVFGVMAYFYPFLLCFVAVMYALDRCSGTVGAKITETSVLAVLVGAAIDIFASGADKLAFGKYLSAAYADGVLHKNGGFLGALIGRPIVLAFGKTGAVITVILLIFVFLMIITGTTLAALFRTLSRPVKSISTQAESAFQSRAEREQQEEEKRKKGFNVDIPVDDIPKKRPPKSADSTLEEKQRRVVSAYYDEEPEEKPERRAGAQASADAEAAAEPPEGAQERAQLDSALKSAEEQAKPQRPAAEEVPFDAQQAEREFRENLSSGIALTEDEGYKFPPLSLLRKSQYENSSNAVNELDNTADRLVETLRSFGVETRIVDISRGPTVTRYELQPLPGVKISKITNLADDIALNLATAGVRIQAPIPNKSAVGIEVPNKNSVTVGVREIIESSEFAASKSKLTIAMGRDIAGNAVIGDIAKMPHGLIAGATGSGKSVCINSIIMSILYKATPDEVKLLMIDPKVVELGVYNGIPHLLVPVVTDPRKAAGALGWAVSEMEKRYKMFADRDVRNLSGYNKLVETLTDEPEVTKMPHIVIIIDELADLMMTAPREVEDSINRIAAKARAAGMHLLIATQRPSVDVVTGVIKANIPTRIAFAVSSQIDSRTILDTGGAEKLLGRGDMLYLPSDRNKPLRIQGAWVSESEVQAVVDYISNTQSVQFDEEILEHMENAVLSDAEKNDKNKDQEENTVDELFAVAVKYVVDAGQASISMLQRKLRVGYARAGRLIDEMAARGLVSQSEGSKSREVLITREQYRELFGEDGEDDIDAE